MTKIVDISDEARIEREAAAWLVRLDSDGLDESGSADLAAWLAVDIRHREKLAELVSLWRDMTAMDDLAALFPLPSPRRRWVSLSSFRPAIAGVFAMLFLGAVYLAWEPDAPHTARTMVFAQAYATAVGEHDQVALPDGSTAHLNTATAVEVSYTEQSREVQFLGGEAFFAVSPDSGRPFVVHTNLGTIRAVGTAFGVRSKAGAVEVTVTEGTVEITPVATAAGDSATERSGDVRRVSAGQSAVYDVQTKTIARIEELPPAQITRKLSWQRGMLQFNGESLADVIAEVSRYTDTEIIIADPALSDIRIGGYFRAGDVDGLLDVLRQGFDIAAEEGAGGSIQLRAAASAAR